MDQNAAGPAARHVPVPGRLVDPHPLVAGLGVDHHRFLIVGKTRLRALRIIQAVADEAERRGYRLDPEPRLPPGWANNPHGLGPPQRSVTFRLRADSHDVRLRLFQEHDRTPHVLTAEERKDRSRWPGTRIREWDYRPAQRLRISRPDRYTGEGRGSWGDGKRQTLEELLPDLFEELDRLAQEAERRHAELRREMAEREQQRLAAERAAEQRRAHERRVAELDRQVDAWNQAHRLREYCSAMQATIAEMAGTEQAEARRWLDWARAHADAIDPLLHDLGWPTDTETRPSSRTVNWSDPAGPWSRREGCRAL